MITKTFDHTKYKLVPIEPTEGMLLAGHKSRRETPFLAPCYSAMLAVAPKAPDAEPVNMQLLEALELSRRTLLAVVTGDDLFVDDAAESLCCADEAIAAAEQRQAMPIVEFLAKQETLGTAFQVDFAPLYEVIKQAAPSQELSDVEIKRLWGINGAEKRALIFARTVIEADRAKRGAK